MNSHTKAFYQRVQTASKALAHLDKIGCAITSLSINDQGSIINILPPSPKKLKGVQTTISGNATGRHHHIQARIHGCTVCWQSHIN
jgi:hypothetical protein